MSAIGRQLVDSLSGFIVFVRVAETRSFAAAARSLGLTASAIGKRVARLEERLGVRLFHRSTRSITLTAEGSLFLERSRRILAEIEASELELSHSREAPSGRLRVSLPLVSSLVLPVLADFMALYPQIELDLDFTDRIVDVIEEGFDVVVRSGKPMDSRLSYRQLGTFGFRVVGAPAYFDRYGVPEQPADLANHICLHYRFPNSGKLEEWPLGFAPGEFFAVVPVSMVCNNIETRLCFARRGSGIACLPQFAVDHLLASGELQQVLNEQTQGQGQFFMLWPSGKQIPTRLRVFIDYLSTRILAAPAPGSGPAHVAGAAKVGTGQGKPCTFSGN